MVQFPRRSLSLVQMKLEPSSSLSFFSWACRHPCDVNNVSFSVHCPPLKARFSSEVPQLFEVWYRWVPIGYLQERPAQNRMPTSSHLPCEPSIVQSSPKNTPRNKTPGITPESSENKRLGLQTILKSGSPWVPQLPQTATPSCSIRKARLANSCGQPFVSPPSRSGR